VPRWPNSADPRAAGLRRGGSARGRDQRQPLRSPRRDNSPAGLQSCWPSAVAARLSSGPARKPDSISTRTPRCSRHARRFAVAAAGHDTHAVRVYLAHQNIRYTVRLYRAGAESVQGFLASASASRDRFGGIVSDHWYYIDHKRRVGPVNLQELEDILSSISNPEKLRVWCPQLSDWELAESVPELQVLLPRPSSPEEDVGLAAPEGSYISKIIQPMERVRFIGRLHWIIYGEAVVSLFLSIGCFWLNSNTTDVPDLPLPVGVLVGTLLLGLSVLLFFKAWFDRWVTEVAVTNRRVIYKRGFIRRRTSEMNMDKIETVEVAQSILGRLFGYGSVHILGTGRGIERLDRIADPAGAQEACRSDSARQRGRPGCAHAPCDSPRFPAWAAPPPPLNLNPRVRLHHQGKVKGITTRKTETSMRKILGLTSASAMLVALLSTNALAWDNCGHGLHRNANGVCVSNYGRNSGCPYGQHLGWDVHRCVAN
jgi:hypothetical protein